MAKKDTAATVLGMLSTTGASTRPTATASEPRRELAEQHTEHDQADDSATVAAPAAPASAGRPAGESPRRGAPPTPQLPVTPAVPRTLRLRASTAAALRDAWLDAKRDDVLLSHQDFASDLLDAALRQRTAHR